MIDYTPGKPDFNILRLGHIEYLVSDLARARDFYVDVVGLFETESDADHVYLRAIEDREHHSVVLTRSPSPGIGHFSFRVSCEEDLERLAAKFKGLGLPMRWLEAGEERGQGRALRVQDPFGFPVEYYAHMDQAPWMLQQYHLHRHGCPTRLDHLNVLVPDAQAGFDWYTRELGFFCSEYTVSAPPEERVWASWLYRKATIHDIAVMTGKGPTVHHAGFSLMEPMGVIRACDALAAAATPTTSSAAQPATHLQRLVRLCARPRRQPLRAVHGRLPDGGPRPGAPSLGTGQPAPAKPLGHAASASLVRGIHVRRLARRRPPAAGVRPHHPRHPDLCRLTPPSPRIPRP